MRAGRAAVVKYSILLGACESEARRHVSFGLRFTSSWLSRPHFSLVLTNSKTYMSLGVMSYDTHQPRRHKRYLSHASRSLVPARYRAYYESMGDLPAETEATTQAKMSEYDLM